MVGPVAAGAPVAQERAGADRGVAEINRPKASGRLMCVTGGGFRAPCRVAPTGNIMVILEVRVGGAKPCGPGRI